jgi:hypothetical protein
MPDFLAAAVRSTSLPHAHQTDGQSYVRLRLWHLALAVEIASAKQGHKTDSEGKQATGDRGGFESKTGLKTKSDAARQQRRPPFCLRPTAKLSAEGLESTF